MSSEPNEIYEKIRDQLKHDLKSIDEILACMPDLEHDDDMQKIRTEVQDLADEVYDIYINDEMINDIDYLSIVAKLHEIYLDIRTEMLLSISVQGVGHTPEIIDNLAKLKSELKEKDEEEINLAVLVKYANMTKSVISRSDEDIQEQYNKGNEFLNELMILKKQNPKSPEVKQLYEEVFESLHEKKVQEYNDEGYTHTTELFERKTFENMPPEEFGEFMKKYGERLEQLKRRSQLYSNVNVLMDELKRTHSESSEASLRDVLDQTSSKSVYFSRPAPTTDAEKHELIKRADLSEKTPQDGLADEFQTLPEESISAAEFSTNQVAAREFFAQFIAKPESLATEEMSPELEAAAKKAVSNMAYNFNAFCRDVVATELIQKMVESSKSSAFKILFEEIDDGLQSSIYQNPGVAKAILKEIDELVERFPEEKHIADFLHCLLDNFTDINEKAALSKAHNWFTEIFSKPDLPEGSWQATLIQLMANHAGFDYLMENIKDFMQNSGATPAQLLQLMDKPKIKYEAPETAKPVKTQIPDESALKRYRQDFNKNNYAAFFGDPKIELPTDKPTNKGEGKGKFRI